MSVSGAMKAIRVQKPGGPDVLKLENIPIPVPGFQEVLIDVKAIGVNPLDTYIRAGKWADCKLVNDPSETTQPFPYTPGADAAGIVAAVGQDVNHVKVGDRVYTTTGPKDGTGAYAEYMIAPANRVFQLPERLSFAQGAALGIPYFTAIRALKYKAQIRPGESVLVHGASGGVGLAIVQMAATLGADVVGTASTEDGGKLVRYSGARLVLNHKDSDHKKNLLDATLGKGFDVVVEMCADKNLELDLEVSAPHGRIVMIGAHGTAKIDPWASMCKEVDIHGLLVLCNTQAEWDDAAKELGKAIEAKKFVNPLVDLELPLERAAEAHKIVEDHKDGGSKGKIVLIP